MPRLHSIDDATRALYEFIPQTVATRAGYSLDRLRAFLAGIGDPQDRMRVVHVAGTSGKTSTSYFIRALLQSAGQVTGLTVSPHIVSVTERVQLDGLPLPDQEFLRYLERFLDIVGASAIPLTYFEVLVAFAQWVFGQRQVDYAVAETGLGGLLDTTNTVTRADKVCVITDLGLDHTEILGDTIEQIAWQKAGIIQPGNAVLMLDQDAAAMEVVTRQAERQGADLRVVAPDAGAPEAAWLPPFQRRNWSLARGVYEHLRERDGLPLLSAAALAGAVSQQPPGRFESYQAGGRALILDGAHNPQKLAALREALRAEGCGPVAVMASLVAAPEEKIAAAMAELRQIAGHLIVPEFTVLADLAKQSPPAEELAGRARQAGIASVQVCQDLATAFAALLARPEPVLVVTGSLYLISQLRPLAQQAVATLSGAGQSSLEAGHADAI